MEKQTLEQLQEQVKDLQEQVRVEADARTKAEDEMAAMAEISAFTAPVAEEQPTGRMIEIDVCTNPAERNAKKLVYKKVKVPTYYYALNLPTGAGLCLSTNGIQYFHGETYEFTQNELADIKSRVARCWDHEKSIHGNNENAYRKPTNRNFGVKRA